MTIYEFSNYKEFVLKLLKKMPKGGHGQFRKMALYLNVNSVIISQIFKGERQLTSEQALDLAEFLGLSGLETEYFVLLVQLERAGTHRLKAHFKKQLHELQEKSKDIKNRVPSQNHKLSEESKALFYSNWYYSGVRLLSSIKGFETVDTIAEELQLSRSNVKRIVTFLVDHGLCVEERGKIKMGPRLTHLEATSPLIARHHTNWRLRAIQNLEPLGKDELFYSGPMALSIEDARWVRAQIVDLIQSVVTRARDSESERLACLNIDWFDFRGRPEQAEIDTGS